MNRKHAGMLPTASCTSSDSASRKITSCPTRSVLLLNRRIGRIPVKDPSSTSGTSRGPTFTFLTFPAKRVCAVHKQGAPGTAGTPLLPPRRALGGHSWGCPAPAPPGTISVQPPDVNAGGHGRRFCISWLSVYQVDGEGGASLAAAAQAARPLSQPRAAAARGGAVTQQRLPVQRPPPAQPPSQAPRRVFALSFLSSTSRRGKAQPGPRSVLARSPRGPPASRHPPGATVPRNITLGLGGGHNEGETAAHGGVSKKPGLL